MNFKQNNYNPAQHNYTVDIDSAGNAVDPITGKTMPYQDILYQTRPPATYLYILNFEKINNTTWTLTAPIPSDITELTIHNNLNAPMTVNGNAFSDIDLTISIEGWFVIGTNPSKNITTVFAGSLNSPSLLTLQNNSFPNASLTSNNSTIRLTGSTNIALQLVAAIDTQSALIIEDNVTLVSPYVAFDNITLCSDPSGYNFGTIQSLSDLCVTGNGVDKDSIPHFNLVNPYFGYFQPNLDTHILKTPSGKVLSIGNLGEPRFGQLTISSPSSQPFTYQLTTLEPSSGQSIPYGGNLRVTFNQLT